MHRQKHGLEHPGLDESIELPLRDRECPARLGRGYESYLVKFCCRHPRWYRAIGDEVRRTRRYAGGCDEADRPPGLPRLWREARPCSPHPLLVRRLRLRLVWDRATAATDLELPRRGLRDPRPVLGWLETLRRVRRGPCLGACEPGDGGMTLKQAVAAASV